MPPLIALTAALLFAQAPAPNVRPLVIAHRGASGYLPEHTTQALAMAFAQGADFIEQDVVLTKDGVPVVLHDVQVDTVTDVATRFPDRKRADGRYYALDLTLAELKALDVRERVDPRTGRPALPGRFPLGLAAGTFRVPTLDEELDLIAGLNASTGREVGVYPELKAPAWHRSQGVELAPPVLAVLARHGFKTKADRCFLQCFEFDELARVRSLGYGGRLVYLMGGRPPAGSAAPDPSSPAGLDAIAKLADGIGPALPMLFRPDGEPTDLVRLAHDRGLVVHPYTIRADALPKSIPDLDAYHRLIFDRAGVDGVFTDFPDRTARFLRPR